MKQTKDTIAEIIDEMSEKITDYGYNDEYGYYSDWKDGVSPIIKASIRTLLESFGEEIINAENKVEDLYPYYQERARNLLRAEQRLKKKEIISSLDK